MLVSRFLPPIPMSSLCKTNFFFWPRLKLIFVLLWHQLQCFFLALMEFNAMKEAHQQSPVTPNQLWDWIYIGTVALSCVAVGAICSALCPCFATFPPVLRSDSYKSFFSAAKILKNMESSMRAPTLLSWNAIFCHWLCQHCLFIFIEWYFSVSDALRRSFMQLWSSSDMHHAQPAISPSFEVNSDRWEVWEQEHMLVVFVVVTGLHRVTAGVSFTGAHWESELGDRNESLLAR